MASALPRVDASVLWLRCPDCSARHRAGARCVRPLVWLVLDLCPDCGPTAYCPNHNVRGYRP